MSRRTLVRDVSRRGMYRAAPAATLVGLLGLVVLLLTGLLNTRPYDGPVEGWVPDGRLVELRGNASIEELEHLAHACGAWAQGQRDATGGATPTPSLPTDAGRANVPPWNGDPDMLMVSPWNGDPGMGVFVPFPRVPSECVGQEPATDV